MGNVQCRRAGNGSRLLLSARALSFMSSSVQIRHQDSREHTNFVISTTSRILASSTTSRTFAAVGLDSRACVPTSGWKAVHLEGAMMIEANCSPNIRVGAPLDATLSTSFI